MLDWPWVSGEAPQDPVVSKTTGHVYERKLIEKYVVDQGKDPMTGEDMSMDDVVSLNIGKSRSFPYSSQQVC